MEIFSGVAAGLTLVEYLVKTSKKLKSITQLLESAESEASSLRTALQRLSLYLDRFKRDAEAGLKREDQVVIKGFLDEANQIGQSCEKAFQQLRSIRPPVITQRGELQTVRTKFARAEDQINKLHIQLSGYILVLQGVGRNCQPDSHCCSPSLPDVPKRRGSDPEALFDGFGEDITPLLTGPTLVQSRTFDIEIDPELSEALKADDFSRVAGFLENHTYTDQAEALKSALLIRACELRKQGVIENLLRRKASYQGLGIVYRAVGRHHCWDEQEEKSIIAILELLVDPGGMSTDELTIHEDGDGKLALHHCVMTNKYRVAKHILELDSDLTPRMVTAVDKNGKTALYDLLELPNPDIRLLKMLLSKGATLGGHRPPLAGRTGQKEAKAIVEQTLRQRRRFFTVA